MLNIYKTDIKRVLKDKLFLVACIIAAAFALLNPLMSKGLLMLLGDPDDPLLEMIGMNAKSLFFTSFAPGNNLGLITPILVGIIICKDFSYGTIRNKIISGKSRGAIFMSLFLSCATAICAIMLLHGAVTLGTSLIFFKYQADPFTMADFWYFVASLLLEILVYIFISALTSFLCVFMKNAGLAVVMYAAANFLFVIIGSIISAVLMFFEADPTKELITKVLTFINNANVFMGTYIGITDKYTLSGILAVLSFTICGAALFAALGFTVFNKKDLK